MKIAVTYDLRDDYLKQGFNAEDTAEFDSIETIAAIDDVLTKMGFSVERVGNLQQLASALVQGKRWDLVFNIAEGLYGFAREAQVPALLDAYHIPYTFSDPLTLALTLDKAMTKRVLRDHGLPIASFQVIDNMANLQAFTLSFPVFAKPLAEGTGKGINAASCVNSLADLETVCQHLIQTFKQPVLVETYLPGREFTVGIIGNGREAKVVGIMEIKLRANAESHAYTYENKDQYEDRVDYDVVDDPEAQAAAETALLAYHALRCRDSARIDLRSDTAGVPHLMEINPIAGLHPVRSDLIIMLNKKGYTYEDCIKMIIQSTLKRLQNKAYQLTQSLCA